MLSETNSAGLPDIGLLTRHSRGTPWHLITPEYPPQGGGVSDYTWRLAAAIAREGEEVHVWCPGTMGTEVSPEGVTVHREFGRFRPADLRRVARSLDAFSAPRRMLVQWVPHGYGYRSMNVGFCWWLARRAAGKQDQIALMIHEAFLSFRWPAVRQNAAALVHRLMIFLLLRSAQRVWVTIPDWERLLRRYALGRDVQFGCLPIFSNVPMASDRVRTSRIRAEFTRNGKILIGHFGTFGSLITPLLKPILRSLAAENRYSILLMGEHSQEFRQEMIRDEPGLGDILQATGRLPAEELSYHLAACDVMIQPYPDGVSARRGSFMAGFCNGCPTVTTTGWLTESFWAPSQAVALAPVGNASAFLKQVRHLCGDPAERERMGHAARLLYAERFDISRTVATLRGAESEKDVQCAF